MKLRTWVYIVLCLALFLSPMVVSMASGTWTTGAAPLSQRAGTTTQGTATDTSAIRGKDTLGEICSTYGIQKKDLLTALGVPTDLPDSTKGSDLEAIFAEQGRTWSMDVLRSAVASLIAH
ncbi:MAG: hypothetical protein ACPL2N_08280 [Candidatus Cryosericum sp.]